MRLTALLLIAALASAADPAPAPPDALPAGYYILDAIVAVPVQSKTADEVRPVRRYYLKDPHQLNIGGRAFLIGDGVRGWQAGGNIAVPVDTIVAIGRFANNVEFARYDGREVEIGNPTKP